MSPSPPPTSPAIDLCHGLNEKLSPNELPADIDGVAHQHGDGHRPNAARDGGDGARHLAAFLVVAIPDKPAERSERANQLSDWQGGCQPISLCSGRRAIRVAWTQPHEGCALTAKEEQGMTEHFGK